MPLRFDYIKYTERQFGGISNIAFNTIVFIGGRVVAGQRLQFYISNNEIGNY